MCCKIAEVMLMLAAGAWAAFAAAQASEADVVVRELAPPANVQAPNPIEPLLPAAPGPVDPESAAEPIDLPIAVPPGLPEAPSMPPVISIPTPGTIVRLPPSAFPELPEDIRKFLEQRGITIPQSFQQREPHNVIQGYFRDVSRPDWAVLCSRNGASAIVVFWRGSLEGFTEFGRAPDNDWLQDVHGDGVLGYSRFLDVATPEAIEQYHKNFGGPVPPPLKHEGINDNILEKASTVWYWHEDRWLELQGLE